MTHLTNISGRTLRPMSYQTGSRPTFLYVLARFRNTCSFLKFSPEIQIPAPITEKCKKIRKFHNLKIELLVFYFFYRKQTERKEGRKKIQCHLRRTTTT